MRDDERRSFYRRWRRRKPHVNISAGGGGEEPYVASAVNLDGTASMLCNSLTAPGDDTGYCSASIWFHGMDAASYILWVVDPANTYSSNAFTNAVAGGGFNLKHAFWNAATSKSLQLAAAEGGSASVEDWHNMLISVQTNHGAGAKIANMYLDGSPVALSAGGDVATAFLMTFNALPFMFGDDGFNEGFIADVADFWFAPGQFIDFSVDANRLKFRDAGGKPVSLGADGSTPTGIAPAVFFSGDATGFATNKGSGGTFALTGSLTNASTSPSD